MGPGRPAWPIFLTALRPPFSPSLLESSGVYTFHDCTPLDVVIFEISLRERTENPSLNLYLLCLSPKYLDLILWALSFGLHWRVDVHERASSRHGLWSFAWALAFVFLRVIAWSWVSSKHLRKCPISCQNITCTKIQDKIKNGQVWVPSGGLVH